MPTVTARTTYIPATDTRGSRIRVRSEGRTYTAPFDHAASDVHAAAVLGMYPGATVKWVSDYFRGSVYDVELPSAVYEKTPEQIADELLDAHPIQTADGWTSEDAQHLAIAAIRADRAQLTR